MFCVKLELVVLRRGPLLWEVAKKGWGMPRVLLFVDLCPEVERNVVAVVSKKWMLFDRSGALADATGEIRNLTPEPGWLIETGLL